MQARRQRPLIDRTTAALLWLAAFSYACGVFLTLTMLTASLPATPPAAIGIVTIEHYSKLRDYVNAALFFVLVPPLTIWLRRIGARWGGGGSPARNLLFTTPFLLAPFFYLTTGKAGWVLILPPAIAFIAVRAFDLAHSSRWLRDLFARELAPYHALLFAEGMGWIVFRYMATGRRIAHISTLFLEITFVALFLALFWCVVFLAARLMELSFGVSRTDAFRRIATAAIPFVALPLVAFIQVPTPSAAIAMVIATLLVMLLALRVKPLAPRTAWRVAAFVLIPFLVFAISYASSAHITQWIDLFHRGESIGPASDYLRGKVPYIDVFPLHGMLEDGLLDAWLMELFGRGFEVTAARSAVIGAFLGVALWFLGLAIFDSIPLAALCVVMGAWTTAENDRTFFQVAAVTLLWIALRRRSRVAAIGSGVFAAVALFFSYDIGVYTIVSGFAACVALAIVGWLEGRRPAASGPREESLATSSLEGLASRQPPAASPLEPAGRGPRGASPLSLAPLRALAMFAIGIAIGAAPFVIYLISRGAFGAFIETSFVTIPRIIDAVWSLPFPDLVSPFRGDNLNLHTLADFVLQEKFHLILSPLVIVVAAIYVIQRLIRRRADTLDLALLVLTIFAAITQRTAFGRAEFRHQYFAAFLIGPMIVILAIVAARSVRELWRSGDDGTRAFVVAVMLIVAPIAAVLFWIPDLINARLDDVINYQRRVLRVQYDPHADQVRDRIDAVSAEVRRLTRGPIYDFSNQPAFYFFCDRPDPTPFYQVPIASPVSFQADVIGRLERSKPYVVIRTSPETFDEFDGVPNTLRAQAIAAYLDDCYAFYRAIRGVEVWTRRADARPRRTADYLRLVRMPKPEEIATSFRERMVFPLAGMAAGANGAFWVSNLTLHNPTRDGLVVTLRFATGQSRLDRQLHLGPRQTLAFATFAESLFKTRGLGTLWIEYRSGHAPIAILETSDVAHGGRSSIERPLTIRDAATFGGDSPELTIVGIPSGAQRRIAIGVVNTGLAPAVFRVSTAGGKSFEIAAAEDDLALIAEPEKKLGITIGPATTIRIAPLTGSGVAFATMSDANGDTQFIPAVPSQK
jgi:hypothetical protein